jgi:hypothetical protein
MNQVLVPTSISDMTIWYMPFQTSGKSTQKAFIFNPYKKLAKFSLNRARLSCINCRCIKFASKSAIESESSAKAGSNASMGASDIPPTLDFPDSRNDDREDGRRGVVGREMGLRFPEVDRLEELPA